MSLIGLELIDAGIMAAGGTPAKLLVIDGQSNESPGFALPEKDGLLVGKAAENKAHLFPRQIIQHFWDQLNTDPLEQPGQYVPQSTAEIAYSHLARIWQQIQQHGDEIIIAVPGFYGRQQLGMILGIANELSMPVKGFVPVALAASPGDYPGKMLIHLDIHLHRVEVTYLRRTQQLTFDDSVTGTEKGLIHLHKQWADAIAQEFVGRTRFDPFHQAASEQELYRRLPGILFNLKNNPSIAFDMTGGSRTYSITLTRDLMTRKAETVYGELRQMVEGLRTQHKKNESAVVLQLTHRLARLPGCREVLAGIKNAEIIELDQGAGARGVLEIWQQLADQSGSEGISFFTSRPVHHHSQPADNSFKAFPTHLLYRNIAYPLSEKPLTIGRDLQIENSGTQVPGEPSGISPEHCSVQLRGREVVLQNLSSEGTFVDDARIDGSTVLQLGQILRLGTPGETFQLIACLANDET